MSQSALPVERRRRRRACVHWTAEFHRPAGTSLIALTENVSSEGLYCLLDERLEPGDILECTLEIPRASTHQRHSLLLRCQTRVIHVHPVEDRFGIGFHIEQYSVLRDRPATSDWANTAKLFQA